MTFFRKFFSSIFLFVLMQIQAQESKIVEILNSHLSQDIAIKEGDDYFDEKLKVLKPFTLKKGILSLELEITTNSGEKYKELREVPLSEIIIFGKDINVIFEAKKDAVKITRTSIGSEKKPEVYQTKMFFTGIRKMKYNEDLKTSILKAFKKANLTIESDYWYD